MRRHPTDRNVCVLRKKIQDSFEICENDEELPKRELNRATMSRQCTQPALRQHTRYKQQNYRYTAQETASSSQNNT